MKEYILVSAEKQLDACAKIDFDLAWRRLRLDHPDRAFITHPHLLDWIEGSLDPWLDLLRQRFGPEYAPSDVMPSYVPKGGWMVRPGSTLTLEDELVFDAIVSEFYELVWKGLKWSQGGPDIAYQLLPPSKKRADWIQKGFRIWREWRQKSVQKLRKPTKYVVLTDITGFYDNIDLNILHSDLSAFGVDPALLKILTNCLYRWSKPKGKGIPQGYSASDILAKVYLAPIDLALRNARFVHVRYVDDIRVFCRSLPEAKNAILGLTHLLRARGLNLQTAKTRIVTVEEAKTEIDGIAPLIEDITGQLRRELEGIYRDVDQYTPIAELDRILKSNPEAPAPEVIERAFRENFLGEKMEEFDRSLFHYLLARLGKAGSKIAVEYATRQLSIRPEETAQMLRYLQEVKAGKDSDQAILKYAASKEAVYDYQLYQIARWFYERKHIPEPLLKLCRDWVYNRNKDQWLRCFSLFVLGAGGNAADLEFIETLYVNAKSDLERADVAAALCRMEKGRRNSFYSRVQNDGFMVRRAIDWARNTK